MTPAERTSMRRQASLLVRRAPMPVLLDVFVEDVYLPQEAVRVAHPDLRLQRIAALDAVLSARRVPGFFETALDFDELFRTQHANASMVQMPSRCRRFWHEREHHRGIRELELGVV